MSDEKVCTLSVDHAIRIAKIIATAPVERMPMITQLFSQAQVTLEGLDELIENSSIGKQNALMDTVEFLTELVNGYPLTDKGYLIPPEEFNQFCIAKGLQPRLVKRHLYAAGYIEGQTEEATKKTVYSIMAWVDGKSQRRVAVKPNFKKVEQNGSDK